MKADINDEFKDQFLIELSNLNTVHIKPKKDLDIKGDLEDKRPIAEKIKVLRKSLNNLFNRLNINKDDIRDLRIKKVERIEFKAQELTELINHILEELEFFINRVTELQTYIAKATIELENLNTLKLCYKHLEKINMTKY